MHSNRPRSQTTFTALLVALLTLVTASVVMIAQSKRDFDVVARKYAFQVSGSDTAEIHVTQDDLVHITFSAVDIAHSFTIDDSHYRIMRRAEPGKSITFDFRAEHPGRFRFYCSLTADEKCKDMIGTLVVDAKR